jgi:hypothetical protein
MRFTPYRYVLVPSCSTWVSPALRSRVGVGGHAVLELAEPVVNLLLCCKPDGIIVRIGKFINLLVLHIHKVRKKYSVIIALVNTKGENDFLPKPRIISYFY